MAGRRKPIAAPGDTAVGEFAREARHAAEGRRKKKSPAKKTTAKRQTSSPKKGEKAYLEAEEKARVGDHAITPELVRGRPAPDARSVVISPRRGVGAELIIGDLLTVLWAEVQGLRQIQQSTGQTLPEDSFGKLWDLADATTKVLREERRQAELDDWSRMSTEELIGSLPPAYQEALGGTITEGEE